MPYITAAQRYNCVTPSPTKQFANLKPEMRRNNTSSYITQPVNYSIAGHQATSPLSYRELASPAVPIEDGFRRYNESGGEAGLAQPGYGGYGQGRYQQDTYAPQTQAWPYERATHRDTYGQQSGWQQYGIQGHRNDVHQRGSSNWQQPEGRYQALYSTTPASQAVQQYATTYLQPQPYELYEPYGFRQNNYWLTQQWHTANNATVPLEAPTTAGQSFYAKPPASRPRHPLKKSVVATDLNLRYRVNKRSRYEQTTRNTGFYDNIQPPLPPPPTHSRTPSTTASHSNGVPWRGTVDVRNIGVAGRTNDETLQPPLRSTTRPTKNPTKYILPRPVASTQYMNQANEDPVTTEHPRPLLIVLDLNGTLLHRVRRGGSNFITRPRVSEFLHYLLKNHCLMIWSSAKPENVGPMCDKLFTKEQKDRLAAIWARDKLRLPANAYHEKVQVYKQLSWVWKDKSIQSANPDAVDYWSQENTVLIDDSMEKAASEPFNVLQLEEFEGKKEQMEVDVLGQVVRYLKTLRRQRNVSAYIRWKPFAYDPEEGPFDWKSIIDDTR